MDFLQVVALFNQGNGYMQGSYKDGTSPLVSLHYHHRPQQALLLLELNYILPP